MLAMKKIVISEEINKLEIARFVANIIINMIFTQMSAKQGIRKHGGRSISAIFKELKQLDVRAKVFWLSKQPVTSAFIQFVFRF